MLKTINKENLLSIFSISNIYNEDKKYKEYMWIILERIKDNENHSEDNYIDNLYFDINKKSFYISIFKDSKENPSEDKEVKEYNLDEVLLLINKKDD